MVTSITGARPHRSLVSLLGAVLNAKAQRRGQRYSQLAAAMKSHLMTFCAAGLVDVGAFHWSQIAGYMITGLSLIVLDAKIQEG